MFIGREAELKFLNDKYEENGGQLIVLYGRRRVGKTETLREFCKGKPHVFFSCTQTTDPVQLRNFSIRMMKEDIPARDYISAFTDWERAFRAVLDLPYGNSKKLLVIDEFPYMCKGNPSIPYTALSACIYSQLQVICIGAFGWRPGLNKTIASSCWNEEERFMKENGSTARGTRAEDSDVDVAILLHAGATKAMRDQMLDLVVDLELECGRVLSVLCIDYDKFAEWKDIIPFYKNIRKDGVVLWQAA